MSTDAGDAGQIDRYRSEAWTHFIHTFATSYIFQRRARQLKKRLQWINYVGIAVPLLVGSLVLVFGPFGLLPVVIVIAGLVGIVQISLNLWSIVGRWVEDYAYALGSAAANDWLAVRFRELGTNPPEALSELRQKYEMLQLEDAKRRELDHQCGITEPEKRMGMRAALRQLRKPCAGCGQVPMSMEPSNCGVCGNFKYAE